MVFVRGWTDGVFERGRVFSFFQFVVEAGFNACGSGSGFNASALPIRQH